MPDAQHIGGEKISIREFARRMGVRDTSVHKAIKSGKIVNGLVPDGKGGRMVLAEVATAEWQANRDPTYAARSETLGQNLTAGTTTPAPLTPNEPAPPPQVAPDATDTSLASAKRAQAVLKVQQMKLEIDKTRGTLVDKAQVYSALYEAGALVKSTILAIPDRVIDDIMAQKTRGEAYQILYEALVDALSTVADATRKKL